MNQSATQNKQKFYTVEVPGGGVAYLPVDIKIAFPKGTKVPMERLHLLGYIPWEAKYLDRVPSEYRGFFRSILPHLEARTTNVHTATCLSLVNRLIEAVNPRVDRRVVGVALALHDSGWSRVSQEDIAASLDYSGLSHKGETRDAVGPKNLHDMLGYDIARQVVKSNEYLKDLTPRQREYIPTIVRNHTFPQKYTIDGRIPEELQIVHDADRFWSYSHENFWQDTIRKGVEPHQYAKNIREAIDGYFLAEAGRAIARELMGEREAELAMLDQQLEAEHHQSATA